MQHLARVNGCAAGLALYLFLILIIPVGALKVKHYSFLGILFYCISPTQRHAKCLEIAVINGAEVNNTDKNGIPVLLFACETAMDNEDMCLLLIQKGAEPNSKQEVGFVILFSVNDYSSILLIIPFIYIELTSMSSFVQALDIENHVISIQNVSVIRLNVLK